MERQKVIDVYARTQNDKSFVDQKIAERTLFHIHWYKSIGDIKEKKQRNDVREKGAANLKCKFLT